MKKAVKMAVSLGLIVTMGFSTVACGNTETQGESETITQEDAVSAEETTEETAETTVQEASTDGDLELLGETYTLDEIITKAKEEGDIQSVGMPDTWANWGLTWEDINREYGITHSDADMSSSEELQMFATEGENGTKDIGDVGYAFGKQAVDEDLVLSYKTSYWDSVPDWAKDPEGKWMVAYTGVTTFLTNTDQVSDVPTSWADLKEGDYTVALGDIGGGTAQAAVIASAYAFGGSMDDLDPAFEFWTELAEAGRINTLDITQQNFEVGEVPVGVIWSYTAIPYKDAITQYKMEATVPSDGAIQSGYASVINKNAPHPFAAALAREYIFSDPGQINLAKSGAVPTRTDIEIPQEIQDTTLSQDSYANAIPVEDADAYAAACEEVVARWNEEIIPLLVQ